jgi:hypothetical protein
MPGFDRFPAVVNPSSARSLPDEAPKAGLANGGFPAAFPGVGRKSPNRERAVIPPGSMIQTLRHWLPRDPVNFYLSTNKMASRRPAPILRECCSTFSSRFPGS